MEAIPAELVEFAGISLELAEIEKCNARFDYPNGLSTLEWACLKGLTRGRDRAESLRNERDRIERKRREVGGK